MTSYADELLWHRQDCMMCRWARLSPKPHEVMCARGRALIKLTLEERHGKDEER